MKLVRFIFLLLSVKFNAQTISGNFAQCKNTEIVLKGYEGLVEKELSKTTTDTLGNFKLNYPKEYVGAAFLKVKDNASIIVLLNKENFTIECSNLKDLNTLFFLNSPENDTFIKGVLLNQEIEKRLVGLNYLLPQYESDFKEKEWILNEITKQKLIFNNFINSLSSSNYVKKYLKLRSFLSEVQKLNKENYDKELILQCEKNFKNLNFNNDEIWNSGLLKEIIISMYKLIENTYIDKNSISQHFIELNKVWLNDLASNATKLEEISEFCFNFFERNNFSMASEHIALSMLNQKKCQISNKNTDAFEQYRKLGIGKIAPDILFNSLLEGNKKTGNFNYAVIESSTIKSLLELPNKYKLLVFGASWCPNCQTDYPSLVGKYKKLKELYDLEVIYVSLDTELESFDNYYKEAPFVVFCDTMGWESQIVKDYHVFATPTYFLLDNHLKIIDKVANPEELNIKLISINNHINSNN